MPERLPMEGVSDAYSRIDFHDWRLLELVMRYSAEWPRVHEMVLRLGEPTTLESPNANRQFRIVFSEVRGFRGEIDLVYKSHAGDAIQEEDHQSVAVDAAFLQKLDDVFSNLGTPPNSDGLKIFKFWLCPHSGEFEILAKGVTIEEIAAR